MNGRSKISFCVVIACLVLGLSTPPTRAFSLLGPFESWMTTTNGFYPTGEGDIGGPMCIGNEYRWNVPMVTYGFDQSFLDYFGTNGVAAVESAIQILNDLPPASQIVSTNYPLESRNLNYAAQAQSLYDLKSQTLSLLLEHMGLAQPTRYIYVLRQWNPVLTDPSNENLLFSVFEGTNISNYVVARNYDPQNLNVSPYVNEALYSGLVVTFPDESFIETFVVDPEGDSYNAVADDNLGAGMLYNGLTRDDIGGLAYLLSTNSINYETLLPGVYGTGTNVDSFVNGAWRPGVDKITFVPQPMDSPAGAFLPMTNQFTDSYIMNGNVMQQQLVRVTSQPDFLFSVADTGKGDVTTPWFVRTGTTNWVNNATSNGNPDGAGPGVIQPPVQIVFNKLGQQFSSSGNYSDAVAFGTPQFWGSFDASANPPVIYPVPTQTGTNQMTVRMWLEMGTYPSWSTTSFEWKPISASGAQFLFQTSTDLTDWVTLFTNSNDGTITTYFVNNPASPTRFYRLVPQ
jgi:hypothetical protein